MLGVLYPLIYEYLYDQKISVGAPFYNAIFIPLTLIAGVFLFFSIDSKWQRSIKITNLLSPMSISLLIAGSSLLLFNYFLAVNDYWILLSVFVGMLILVRYMFVIYEYLFRRKYSNLYSITAHLGLSILIISIALNSEFSSERALNIRMNESDIYGGYEINFDDLRLEKSSNYDAVIALSLIHI